MEVHYHNRRPLPTESAAGAVYHESLEEMLDEATGRTRVRMLDVDSVSYATARMLQVRLEAADFDTPFVIDSIARVTRLDQATIRKRYG